MDLGSVVKVNPEQARRDYPYEEIEYIDISSVGTGILLETKQLEFANAPSRAKRIVRNGDIILATVRPNLRAFWFAQNIQDNTIASTGFAVLRANEKADSRFIYYTVTNQLFTDYLTANAKGAAYPAVDTETIERADVHLPTLPIQRKIAAILSAYDDLIENNLRRIKILEEMAQNLYREWFVNFRFPGHENTRFVDSPLGRIPEGWEVVRATDAIYINPRISVLKESVKPYVAMNGLSTDSMLISNVGERTGNSGSKYKNNDTLFARITPCLEHGKIGFVTFLPNDESVGLGSTEFIVLRSKTLCPEYVYFLARNEDFRDNAIKSMSGASGRQRVQYTCFDNFYFAHPDSETLLFFADIVRPYFHLIRLLADKNVTLRQTLDILLPKLISGEVDVSELDIKVPKEVSA